MRVFELLVRAATADCVGAAKNSDNLLARHAGFEAGDLLAGCACGEKRDNREEQNRFHGCTCTRSGGKLARRFTERRATPSRPIFSGMKKSGHTPLMLPAPTARRVPTETGFKLRVGSELTTIERLPVCNLGDHFCSEWGKRQSAPRCSGLQCKQRLRAYFRHWRMQAL
jgi:hypothetical protein